MTADELAEIVRIFGIHYSALPSSR
jgi:hypothetical protein